MTFVTSQAHLKTAVQLLTVLNLKATYIQGVGELQHGEPLNQIKVILKMNNDNVLTTYLRVYFL
jgi:hypothetical protein